jgi:hypothetical protein
MMTATAYPRRCPARALANAYSSFMLVATRSFITDYYGEESRLIAGISRVTEEYDIARRHPDFFKPADGEDRRMPQSIRSGMNAKGTSTRKARVARLHERIANEPDQRRSEQLHAQIAYLTFQASAPKL